MGTIADYVYDTALAVYDTEADQLHICSQEPTTYTEATSTYSLGSKTGISVGAPTDAATGGRQVTVAAITDGTATANGTATHWAIVDSANSRLLGTNTLAASQVVTAGNPFTLAAFTITIPDPA